MNTKSSANIQDIKKKFESLLTEKNFKEGIEHDALILMSSYLSEIERIQEERKIKRNKLAELIKTSASYLTQVFRGDKPLNFITLAKIQRVLNIGFEVKAYPKNEILQAQSYSKPIQVNVTTTLKNYKFCVILGDTNSITHPVSSGSVHSSDSSKLKAYK